MVTFIVRDGVEGITIRHRIDGPGFKPPVGIRHVLSSTPVLYGPGARSHRVPRLLSGGKGVGA